MYQIEGKGTISIKVLILGGVAAGTKAAAKLLRESYAGYNTVRTVREDISVKDSRASYGLLPVWKYIYRYKEQDYPFYVNGQTGKIVGTAPFSRAKFLAYTGTLWACLTAALALLQILLGLL